MKRMKESSGDIVFNAVNTVVLTLAVLLVLYPLWFVLIASISNPTLMSMGKVLLIPKEISFNAYKTVITDPNILIPDAFAGWAGSRVCCRAYGVDQSAQPYVHPQYSRLYGAGPGGGHGGGALREKRVYFPATALCAFAQRAGSGRRIF